MTRQRTSSFPNGATRANSAPYTYSGAAAPSVLGSALTAQKESEGTASYSATAAVGTAGATILSWIGVRTALFAGPVTGNNGNSHTQEFSQDYGNGFTNYSLRGYSCLSASGSGNHSVTGSKSSSTTEEATIGLLVLSGGTIGSRKSIVQRAANGAGATLTSGIVTTTGPALLVATCSGDGDVNATAPTQTWPTGEGWVVRESVAFGSGAAPNGHIPIYIATREVASAGAYSVGVQMAINEGATIAIYAVQA